MDPELMDMFDVVVPMVSPVGDVADDRWGIGVSLSGGGFRACLLGLGALLAVVDAGRANEVRSIASVSGGSLANAFVWSRMDFRATDPNAFSALTREAVDLVSRGAIAPTKLAKVRLASLVLLAAAAVFASFVIGSRLTSRLQTFGVVAAAALAAIGLVRLRGRLLQANLQQVWFERGRSQLGVEEAPADPAWWSTGVDFRAVKAERAESTLHLIAVTDLAASEPVYFTQDALIARRLTYSLKPMRVADAVRLSMSVPLALPPSRRRISKIAWTEFTREPDHMLLCDGGLFNNLGTDWDNYLRDSVRAADYGVMHPSHEIAVARRVVVDAGRPTTIYKPTRVPLLSGFFNLWRAVSVIYAAGLEGRRQSDIGIPDQGRTMVTSLSNVYSYRRAVLAPAIEMDKQTWSRIRRSAASVPTTLRALRSETGVCLVASGYLRTAIQLAEMDHTQAFPATSWHQWLGAAVGQAMAQGVGAA